MTTTISAVILAGGQGKRMGGVDKGLQLWRNQPLFKQVYQKLLPQIDNISISANRHQDIYAQSGLSVFADPFKDFQGPLAGIYSALGQAKTDLVLFVPCDCPFLPNNLLEKLLESLLSHKAKIAYAYDGERAHPTFCLISTSLKDELADYLATGQRKMLCFMQQNQAIAVDFCEQKECFRNFNTIDDLRE
ncbi:molybdenum cofactor guanylyltransferase MobA [[Haemophilus] felis]|uniref:Molybdenum cofactor guanylyltransferase n=1 Tax=[Haemophilus] felis TaxID=123822 RepID=A0A1T0AWQ0_9PAST|nr:molybdenum cofactor guanylyltransferase MobA [[Haemophilus] felis]NBI41380.1 molybdenum cofactor guanylyltransferase MobA [[Haemophilus] felis]NBI43256.1 molybdenum cofactor guanylyltransferase MobA [[Haemophilus] felis]OOS01881.1 molybdenum cofactor guanylyltransferase MobA [[Haemophilus] felis]